MKKVNWMGWSSNDSSDGGRRRQKKKKQKRTTAACTGVLMRLNSMQGRPIDRCAPHSLHRRQAHPLVGAVLGHQECHLLFCLPFAGCQTGNACGSRFLSAFSHMKNQFIDFFFCRIDWTNNKNNSQQASQPAKWYVAFLFGIVRVFVCFGEVHFDSELSNSWNALRIRATGAEKGKTIGFAEVDVAKNHVLTTDIMHSFGAMCAVFFFHYFGWFEWHGCFSGVVVVFIVRCWSISSTLLWLALALHTRVEAHTAHSTHAIDNDRWCSWRWQCRSLRTCIFKPSWNEAHDMRSSKMLSLENFGCISFLFLYFIRHSLVPYSENGYFSDESSAPDKLSVQTHTQYFGYVLFSIILPKRQNRSG